MPSSPTIRVNLTLTGVFIGSLLDDDYHLNHAELLAVTLDALILPDGTAFAMPPVQGLLEFDPAHTTLGVMWRLGDVLQVSGQLAVTRPVPGRNQYATLVRQWQQTRHALVNPTNRWLETLPDSPVRRNLAATVKRFQRGRLAFTDCQDRLRQQATPLAPNLKTRLYKLQRQQTDRMRQFNATLERLAPSRPLITHPTRIVMHRLMPSPRFATRIERLRLGNPDYTHQLLVGLIKPR
ncbi:hypothetical protein [Lacticaseibacillus suihuaensis]